MHATEAPTRNISDDEPLPSIDLEALRRKISKSEVDAVFHLPLSAITSPARLRSGRYRGNRLYWPINVSDLVDPANVKARIAERGGVLPNYQCGGDDSEVGAGGFKNTIELWGLSGWYMTMLMRILQIYRE